LKILNFGSINIDNVYKVDNFVSAGETIASLDFEMHCGGKGLNQSVALAQAGIEVYHAGKIGKDGTFLLEYLKEKGANVDNIIIDDTAKTGHTIIQVDKFGQNCILLHSGANEKIKKSEIVNTLLNFTSGDILLVQNEISNLEAIINTAHDMGMFIVFNPSPINEALLNLPLDKINLFVLNQTEGSLLTGAKRPDTVLKILAKKFPLAEIVLTLGKKGSIYHNPQTGEKIEIEADEAKAVDSTGAGDTFLGYFLAARIKGLKTLRSMKIASYAASISVSRKGAAESIPKIELPK